MNTRPTRRRGRTHVSGKLPRVTPTAGLERPTRSLESQRCACSFASASTLAGIRRGAKLPLKSRAFVRRETIACPLDCYSDTYGIRALKSCRARSEHLFYSSAAIRILPGASPVLRGPTGSKDQDPARLVGERGAFQSARHDEAAMSVGLTPHSLVADLRL